VTVVDPVLVLATQARHPLYPLAGVPDLDFFQPQACFHFLAHKSRRNRVSVILNSYSTASPHPRPQPLLRLQAPLRQRPQLRHLGGDRGRTTGVALPLHGFQQRDVRFATGEVPAAAQQQGLLDGLLEVPVRRLDVAILVAAGRVGGLPLQAIVSQQRPIAGRELVRLTVVMHGQRHTVGTMPLRCGTKVPERILKAGAQAGEALGKAQGDVLPVGMGQHEVVQQVREGRALNGDLQVVHRREVGGRQSAGRVLLGEEDFLGRAVLGFPLSHAPLESAAGRLGALAGLGLLQPVPEGLGLQAGLLLQLFGHRSPDLGEGIRACPPGVGLACFLGGLTEVAILPGSFTIHVSPHRRCP
jgi:hypothetical protein